MEKKKRGALAAGFTGSIEELRAEIAAYIRESRATAKELKAAQKRMEAENKRRDAENKRREEAHRERWRWMLEPGGEWHEESSGPLERDEYFVRQANAFLDAVEGKAEPLCTLEEGVQTLRVNLAALESADRATWVTVR